MLNWIWMWYNPKDRNTEIRGNFEEFRGETHNPLICNRNKKRPNTIPVFGPGKWLLGESRALKVGINAG
ncbi:hypothetical protein E4898_01970 [Salmonella enterica subsp. enterica serovar Anatum]|uniref:Uncharacterized protein n=4 Tax=Salmonella enterica TaxID=28901 RepID=A0A735IL66_SALET|nr:hypothetical protein [Salmonella enterica]EAO5847724.1 hypothetical protein [Salmonella enterica subsp. enterica serovar Cerro]EAV8216271.1 hypothetical protein [Salmonella enterica subsp. enterica]EAX7989883.1 hypothetical protein [Salmonella enterica subsp. enterica serovar Lille]EBH3452294.1 hypothetical protein [Salmonella enterica subsp. enterica serovar Anatum]ECK9459061.1 hypothetical protein [Salmonella enterica subsp. enterica serovar Sendai str. CFSAN000621]ECO0921573.1 hypotheti